MDTRWCTSKDAGIPKGLDWGVLHQLEKGTSDSEDAGPRRGVDGEIPQRLERRMKHFFFIRVWKPLPSIRVLKTLRESSKRKSRGRQYLLAVDLGCYKWYQSQTPGDVLVRRLSLEGRWCTSKDAGSQSRWIGESHINWRRERVTMRTLGLEERWMVRSHNGWRE